ncbi:HAD family hydrolase [Sporanaerobacter acetigenes]|jgi:P-type E1-E2 ATPase|uniref:ATPase, P-type (Transporting), HAD superfamily, subfamily IC n=1 Tax=Sporanaerobacter acetigenes DSM 13106 TaxID=1123281 RepID=A0A1M5X9L3_9FIRM|nr:HAD hydrolase family protein [Sporanaerobacter acetigenes]SHH96466.1 ATPase, P-type (transporting), HAD superfamily, subfamily IC [Sporanaerobacter acetigenes DSM 13106]
MMKVDIPGYKNIEIENVVFDYNGTIAEDGILIEGVGELILELVSKGIKVYVLTADTNGTVRNQCEHLPAEIEVFDGEEATIHKRKFVEKIGKYKTVSIGNGRNDIEMFQMSRLSIAVIGSEGCFSKALISADIVVNNIIDAIQLILKPHRLKATMRN